MKLIEIIELVDTLVPNSIVTKTKIQWINQVQNQLFRDYPIPESVKPFTVNQEQQLYSLPDDCPEDCVREVVIGEFNYPFISRGQPGSTPDQFFTFVSGTLMIYPAPMEQTVGFIYYIPRPVLMTTATMEVTPSFPSDFHELLVFACASRVAKSNKDTLALANVFDTDYRILAEKADLVLKKKRPSSVHVTRSWS